ncbi:MAG: hypothetical protein U5J63_10030 [Fodinibius sp.]|nr:hypothetical protein [Fodinibius sp.]
MSARNRGKVFDDQPFLKEEKKLIDSISDTLASKIDRIYARRKLRDSKDRWKKLVNNDPDLIQITTPEGVIEFHKCQKQGHVWLAKSIPKN